MSATVKNKLGSRYLENKQGYLSIEDNITNNNM